jgi:hypothetical protein
VSDSSASSSRARLLFALAAGVGLVAAVAVVAIGGAGSSDDAEVAEAPAECVRAWNDDPAALNYGLHNSVSHAYLEVHATRLETDGSQPADPEEGVCAMVFARTSLDPEPGAAAMVLRNREWVPLSSQRGVEADRLAELQSNALELANADLETDGTITIPGAP